MADQPELFPCPCGATRERECRMPKVCARANWRDTVYGSDSKVEAALHGSTALDAVLRAWALDAADPLALLARMAEGEAPESIVQELRQMLHDTGYRSGYLAGYSDRRRQRDARFQRRPDDPDDDES